MCPSSPRIQRSFAFRSIGFRVVLLLGLLYLTERLRAVFAPSLCMESGMQKNARIAVIRPPLHVTRQDPHIPL